MAAEQGTPLAYILQVVGEAEASADLQKFDAALEQTATKAEDAGRRTETLSSSFDRASEASVNVGKSTTQYSGALSGLGETTAESITKSRSMVKEYEKVALGFGSAASGAFALFNQYDHLQKVQVRIEQAEKATLTTRAGLIDSQRTLDSLIAKGVTSGAQYESAQLKVAAATDAVSIAEQKLGIFQGDLTQGQLSFALTVMPTVFSAISGVTGAMTALRAIQSTTTAGTAVQSTVNLGSIGSFTALGVAAGGAAGGMTAMSVATRLFQIALGPVGWIILGVGTAMTLFATNAFGVRDAINAAGKAIGDAVPILRPLLEALQTLASTIFPEAAQEAEAMSSGVGHAMGSMADSTVTAVTRQKTAVQSLKEAFSEVDFSGAIGELEESLGSAADKADKFAENMNDSFSSIKIPELNLEFPDIAGLESEKMALGAEIRVDEDSVRQLKEDLDRELGELAPLQLDFEESKNEIASLEVEVADLQETYDRMAKKIRDHARGEGIAPGFDMREFRTVESELAEKIGQLEQAKTTFDSLSDPIRAATDAVEDATSAYEDALNALAEKQGEFGELSKQITESDFRSVPSPIGPPVTVFDPRLGGEQRVSELADLFKEANEHRAEQNRVINDAYKAFMQGAQESATIHFDPFQSAGGEQSNAVLTRFSEQQKKAQLDFLKQMQDLLEQNPFTIEEQINKAIAAFNAQGLSAEGIKLELPTIDLESKNLAAEFAKFQESYDKIKASSQEAAVALESTFTGVGSTAEELSSSTERVRGAVTGDFDKVAESARGMQSAVGGDFASMADKMLEEGVRMSNELNFLGDVMGTFQSTAKASFDSIAKSVDSSTDAIVADLKRMAKEMKDVGVSSLNAIASKAEISTSASRDRSTSSTVQVKGDVTFKLILDGEELKRIIKKWMVEGVAG